MLCKGKTAIVTGAAGKGMGRSIALTLAREGANVIVNYRTSAEAASSIVKYIEGEGGKATAFQADICQKEQCESMVTAAIEIFGQVDVCIIGPGGGWHPEPIDRLNMTGAMDDVNKEIAPLYNLMPLVIPGMYERGWGRLIGISMGLSMPSPSYAYDAAKAARTHALLRASREAWRHGVAINIIAPGPVKEIESLDEAIELCNHGKRWEKRSDLTPQDIAEGVGFLCSEAGRFVTGCELSYRPY